MSKMKQEDWSELGPLISGSKITLILELMMRQVMTDEHETLIKMITGK
jgi:hypothetical protein